MESVKIKMYGIRSELHAEYKVYLSRQEFIIFFVEFIPFIKFM
jgi:hypothetical protein